MLIHKEKKKDGAELFCRFQKRGKDEEKRQMLMYKRIMPEYATENTGRQSRKEALLYLL